MSDAKIQGIQQVALTVKSLKQGVEFYRDTLGLSLMFETNGMAFFNVGGIRLMIGEAERGADMKPGGGSVVYFTVADVRKATAELQKKGIEFPGKVETVNRTPTHDLLLSIFKDPDGNLLAYMGETPRAS
jgi:predicted enzyme related to lactoylglutathione lyase